MAKCLRALGHIRNTPTNRMSGIFRLPGTDQLFAQEEGNVPPQKPTFVLDPPSCLFSISSSYLPLISVEILLPQKLFVGHRQVFWFVKGQLRVFICFTEYPDSHVAFLMQGKNSHGPRQIVPETVSTQASTLLGGLSHTEEYPPISHCPSPKPHPRPA
jgi:hypothetical protein